MIGKICKALTPFYDNQKNRMAIKGRPALVIAKADADDYVVLPISSITHKENIDPIYDIKIDPADFPRTKLAKISYVRTHKQTTIHRASLTSPISDLRTEYRELYEEIIQMRAQFSENITEQALK